MEDFHSEKLADFFTQVHSFLPVPLLPWGVRFLRNIDSYSMAWVIFRCLYQTVTPWRRESTKLGTSETQSPTIRSLSNIRTCSTAFPRPTKTLSENETGLELGTTTHERTDVPENADGFEDNEFLGRKIDPCSCVRRCLLRERGVPVNIIRLTSNACPGDIERGEGVRVLRKYYWTPSG